MRAVMRLPRVKMLVLAGALMGGPRFTFNTDGQVVPYAQFLVGFTHWFDDTDFAPAIGGDIADPEFVASLSFRSVRWVVCAIPEHDHDGRQFDAQIHQIVRALAQTDQLDRDTQLVLDRDDDAAQERGDDIDAVMPQSDASRFGLTQQARLVEATYPDPADQTRVFGTIEGRTGSSIVLPPLLAYTATEPCLASTSASSAAFTAGETSTIVFTPSGAMARTSACGIAAARRAVTMPRRWPSGRRARAPSSHRRWGRPGTGRRRGGVCRAAVGAPR